MKRISETLAPGKSKRFSPGRFLHALFGSAVHIAELYRCAVDLRSRLFSEDEGNDRGNRENCACNDKALVPAAVSDGPDHGGDHRQGDGDGVRA